MVAECSKPLEDGETERQLYERYSIDIREYSFLRGVYASELERFKRGAFSELFKVEPAKAQEKMGELLHGLTQEAFEHLRRSILRSCENG